jgi:hypothetical protein
MQAELSTQRSWIGWPLIAGCVVGVPAGCLLAYLALLPMFLGLFFFLLVGMVVGAVTFRFGKAAAPIPPTTLRLIGAAVAVLVWTTGLVVEYLDFPREAARAVRHSLAQNLTADQQDELADRTRQHVLTQLTGRDFRGGFLDHLLAFSGYLKWAATRGTMRCPRIFDDSTHTVRLSQRGIGWLIRVIVSLGLLAFAILSQVLGLAKAPGPPPDGTQPEQPASGD